MGNERRPLFEAVVWVGSSRGDLREFPEPVQGKHRDTKALSGFGGAGVLEAIRDFRGDTFRAVYTVRYAGAVYVLHAFQKKSTTGRQTPRRDIEMIRQRLRAAEQIAKEAER